MRTEHVYDGFMATASVETANVGKDFHHKRESQRALLVDLRIETGQEKR
jgi:hypothetical protein